MFFVLSGGQGGIGIINPIQGSTIGQLSAGNYWIAGGGGGADDYRNDYHYNVTPAPPPPSSPGGLGGGGSGGEIPGSGSPNTGGGGGGANFRYVIYQTPGNGGSGVVILSISTGRYTGLITGNPKIDYYGSTVILSFTGSSGSYTA